MHDGAIVHLASRAVMTWGNPLFSRWIIYVSHDEASGRGTENVLIDNILITAVPEPAHCIGIAKAQMICGWTRRRKRRQTT